MHDKDTSHSDLERSPEQGDFFIENLIPPGFVLDLIKRLPEIRAKAVVAKQKLDELEAGIDPKLEYSASLRDLHKLSHIRVAKAASEMKSRPITTALGREIYRHGTAPPGRSRGLDKPDKGRDFPTVTDLLNQHPIIQENYYRNRLFEAAAHPEDAISAITTTSDRISWLICRSWRRVYPFTIGVSLYMVTPSKYQPNIMNLNRFTGMEHGVFYGQEEPPGGFMPAQLEDHIQLIMDAQAEATDRKPKITVDRRGFPQYYYFEGETFTKPPADQDQRSQ